MDTDAHPGRTPCDKEAEIEATQQELRNADDRLWASSRYRRVVEQILLTSFGKHQSCWYLQLRLLARELRNKFLSYGPSHLWDLFVAAWANGSTPIHKEATVQITSQETQSTTDTEHVHPARVIRKASSQSLTEFTCDNKPTGVTSVHFHKSDVWETENIQITIGFWN